MRIGLNDIQAAFPELTELQPLGQKSGQKVVLKGRLGERAVALKIVRRVQKITARVQREIEAVKRLSSPHVPRIHANGFRNIRGLPMYYMIEDFITGRNLREILRRSPVQPLPEVLRLGRALLSACVALEQAHLVHRDIKPENILIDGEGKIWLIDLGLVRILDMESLTVTGLYKGVGTVGYAPPEQFLNLKDVIDSRTDLFAVGIVMYEALNGSNPYLADWPKVMVILKKMQTEDLPPLTIEGDPEGRFSRFLQSLTARSPRQRPPSAAAAWEMFEDIRRSLGFPLPEEDQSSDPAG